MSDDLDPKIASLDRPRVLVVDDDKALRLHARMALEASGVDACEASNGADALELLSYDSIDAVLLDVRMPDMDGFEACRRIRDLQGCESLPVIMATGLDSIEDVDAALHAGATDFVVKPINWSILKHRIRYALKACATAEELLATADYRRGLLSTLRDVVLRLDRDGRVVESSLRVAHSSGDDELFPVGRYLSDSLPNAVGKSLQGALASIRSGANQAHFEFKNVTGSGVCYYEINLAQGGRGDIVALVRDCTERHEAEARIRQLAYYDRVTGLPNREMMQ